jgi:hypothetical protein
LPPFQVALLDPWLSWLHGVMSLHAACECASRARSHTTLCVWWRRLPPHSSHRELHGARLCLACCRPRRPRRRDRRALHALALLYSMLLIHVPFIRPMTLTGSGLRLYARYDWQPGGRLESGKFESGLLPQFQQQLRALLFCVWFGVLRIASYLWVSLLGLGVFGAVLAVAYYVFVYCTVSLALSHTSNHSLTCLSIKPPIF